MYEGTCMAAGGELIESPPFEGEVEMCELVEASPCDMNTGLCVPQEYQVCYFLERGDDGCEAGQEYTVHSEFRDLRRCDPCTCDVNEVGCSVPSYALLLRPDCAPDFGPHPRFDGECSTFRSPPGEGAQWSFIQEKSPITGACMPSTSRGRLRVLGRSSQRLCCSPQNN